MEEVPHRKVYKLFVFLIKSICSYCIFSKGDYLMADKDLMFKKWAAALNEYSQNINNKFMKNPQAALAVIQPCKYLALQSNFRSYLKDCGVPDFLGECDARQYELYTSGLFSGRKDLGVVTDIAYGHWNYPLKDLDKQCWLLSSPDQKTAAGLCVKVTAASKDCYRYIVIGPKKGDTWELSQKDWNEIKKKSLGVFEEHELVCYMLLQFLCGDVCPKNMAKLKVERIYSK